jgi:hypothetical protein
MAGKVKAVRDPVEKIAREICWLGFQSPRPETTKAKYWEEISEGARRNYRCDARRFVFLYHALPVDLLNETAEPVTPAPKPRRKK